MPSGVFAPEGIFLASGFPLQRSEFSQHEPAAGQNVQNLGISESIPMTGKEIGHDAGDGNAEKYMIE